MVMLQGLLKTGVWVGEGVLRLSMFEEVFPMKGIFYVAPLSVDSQELSCLAEYRIAGYRDLIINYYNVHTFYRNKFTVAFENLEWGRVEGKGFLEKDYIGIEYGLNHAGFEGFESYQFNEDTFHLTQQYTIGNGLRSEGEITATKRAAQVQVK